MGKSGAAAAHFLKNRGAQVTINDKKSENAFGNKIQTLKESGIRVKLGSHDPDIFEEADVIVLSPGVPHTMDPIVAAEKRGTKIIGEMELASRFIKEDIVAVTGTNGKTTTTSLIGEMMKESGFNVFVGGNIGNPLIGYVQEGKKADIVVAEVSSFQLDTIVAFRPKVAVLLNITEDHLDRYPDFNAYADSKINIFKNQKKEDFAVLNAGDKNIRRAAENIRCQKLIYNSGNPARDNIYWRDNSLIVSFGEKEPIRIELHSPGIYGKHNQENVSAAILASLASGGRMQGLKQALDRFSGLSHRLEFVKSVAGIRFFNDSKATNTDAVKRALESFEKSPVILIMGGQAKGCRFAALCNTIKKHARAIVAMGESKDEIESEFQSIVPVHKTRNMAEAVKKSYKLARNKDVVLLSPACASFDMFDDYAHRGKIFCQEVEKLP